MNMADIDTFPLRVRALQDMYHQAHQALICWGAWSRDRRGIFPAEIACPSLWDNFKRDETDAYGDEDAAPAEVPHETAKAERADEEPYNELQGRSLDERLHWPGGPNQEIRRVLRIVYVMRDTHESLYPRAAGCSHDAFCERLESGLLFAGRFV